MKNRFSCLLAICVTLTLVLPVRADYSNTVMGLNPIAYYRLSETTPVSADTATNLGTAGLTGTALYINSPFHQAPGALVGSTDSAVGLNGTSQRVAVPYDSSINPTGPFTAEVWVNPASSQVGTSVVCPLAYWSQPSGRTGWLIYQGSAGWNLRMYNGINTSQVVDITGGGAPVVGTWYHLAVVYDGTNALFYVNGALAGQQSAAAYAPNASGPLSIGARSDANFWFPGYEDEVAVYARALSPDDILAHYANGINPTPSQSYDTLVLGKSPVLYYRLNEPVFTPGPDVFAANLGSLGTGADGTYEAGALTGVAGPPFTGFGTGNTAMRISALAGDVMIPAQAVNTGVFTITCWFKRSGAHVAGQALVFNRRQSDQALATGLGFGYNGSPGVDQLNVHWNEGPSGWLTGLIPPNDVWCFGGAVYTPTNVTVYLNDASGTFSTALTPHDFSIAPIYIGWDFPFTRFSGSIDEVALFDRALAPAEVSSLFTASQMTPQFLSFTRTPADPLFEGYDITMTATVSGVSPIGFQWYKNNAALPGKTTTTLSLMNAALGDSGSYTLVATNSYGATTSSVQTLTISSGPPMILAQVITNATRAIGGHVTYSVVAGGSAPLSYQWKKGDVPVAGTTTILKLSNLQLSDAGSYSVTISNPFGSTNSTSATVSVFAVTNFPYAAMYGNPLAYYRMNETSGTTAYDIAGGLNGSIAGSMALNVAGPQPATWGGLEPTNTAFQFDGTGTRVQLPPFNLQTNQMSIVAWINPAGPQKDQTGILNTRSQTGTAGFFLNYNNNNALSYVWEGTASWSDFQSGLVPVVGQWNFVALVIDPAKGTVYLDDGTGAGLKSASYAPSQGNKTVSWDSPNIGVDLGYDRWFNGAIDEVVVYDRALSPAEVYNLDLLGTTWPGPAPQLLAQPGSATVIAGQPASFGTLAVGALPLTYQWHHAGTNLPAGTGATLAIPSAYFTDAGNYDVLVSNPVGASNSQTATLSVLAPPTFANLTNELVLHLRFDGNYLDSSGRGNDAAAVGTPSFLAGKIGQGVHINSSPNNNYLVVNDNAGDLMFEETNSFTVSFWINYTVGFNDVPIIGNAVKSTYQPGWVFTDSGTAGKLEWSLVSTADSGTYLRDPIANCPTIGDGAWHLVTGVVDREQNLASAYIDGILADQWSIVGLGSLNPGYVTTIGEDPTGAYGSATFDMDDLGIWRRALTAYEVAGIFGAAKLGNSFDVYGPVLLSILKAGGAIELIWQAGTLESSSDVKGTYAPVAGAAAPYHRVTPGLSSMFFRVRL